MSPNSNTVSDRYTVQKGDSLWSIAKKFNVGVSELKSANSLKDNLIRIGQTLIIPGFAPSDQTNVTYIVQKGDTLYSIANSNNTTIDELVNLNDLVTNNIYPGQILKIPASINEESNNIDMNESFDNVYTVQKGDTLYSIALKYNTTPYDIINKNNLSSNILTIGEQLIIPEDTESTGNEEELQNRIYIVQKGDTLWGISNRYGVDVNSIKAVNNLNSNILSIGQQLIIP